MNSFSIIKSFCNLLVQGITTLDKSLLFYICLSLASPKVEICLWHVMQNAILTRCALFRRHIIDDASNICPLFNFQDEISCHPLIHNKLCSMVWAKIPIVVVYPSVPLLENLFE